MKRTLVKRYQEGTDYIIKSINGKLGQEDVFLSVDCLERVALSSKAPNSEQVRTYFYRDGSNVFTTSN